MTGAMVYRPRANLCSSKCTKRIYLSSNVRHSTTQDSDPISLYEWNFRKTIVTKSPALKTSVSDPGHFHTDPNPTKMKILIRRGQNSWIRILLITKYFFF